MGKSAQAGVHAEAWHLRNGARRAAFNSGHLAEECVVAFSVPAAWLPPPHNLNALPDRLRRYIHDLESNCDPQGDLRELFRLREENLMLRKEYERLANLARGNYPQG